MSRTVLRQCPQCKNQFEAEAGRSNRANKIGAPLYCGMACAGLSRRLKNPPTTEEKKTAKAIYDRWRRKVKAAEIKAKKKAYREANKERLLAKEKANRHNRMPYHLEYCRRHEYVAKKKAYDQRYRAKKYFGEFAEPYLVLLGLEAEIDERASNYERRLANGTINKSQTRRRALR